MRRFYRFASFALALGIVHTALTPLFYRHLTTDALWFAGTGLALVFLGLLNIASERAWKAWMLNICIAANFVACIYGGLILSILPEIQAYAAMLIFAAVFTGSVSARLELARLPGKFLSPGEV